MKKIINKQKWGYIFVLPWLLLFFTFILFPFILSIKISLTEYDFVTSNFVFFDNYKEIFSQKLFIRSIFTTLILAIIVAPTTILLSLWIANTIRTMRKGFQSFIKACFYLPSVVSSVALVIAIKQIFTPGYGLVNYLIRVLKLPEIDWYGSNIMALLLISGLVIMAVIGVPIILYSAAMSAVPKSFYEAADIDGASEWRKFISITIPLIKPTTLYVLITQTIASLQIFEFPFLLTAGGPYYGTTTIMLLLYRTAFEFNKFGLAASMGIVLFIIIAIISLVQFRLSKSDIQY